MTANCSISAAYLVLERPALNDKIISSSFAPHAESKEPCAALIKSVLNVDVSPKFKPDIFSSAPLRTRGETHDYIFMPSNNQLSHLNKSPKAAANSPTPALHGLGWRCSRRVDRGPIYGPVFLLKYRGLSLIC